MLPATPPRGRRPWAWAALPLALVLATPAWANRGAGKPPPAPADTTKTAQPAASTTPTAQGMEDAVASVVVVALTEQFDGKVISVHIDDYNVAIASPRERTVSGRGTVAMGDGKQTVAFTYRALYDVTTSNAGYPAIAISGVGGGNEHVVPNDAGLIGELDDRVVAALSKDLAGKQVWLQLDDIESFESGQRYVRINAAGLADFGVDGSTPARVEALYDRQHDTWLRVNYELGAATPAPANLLGGG